MTGKWATSWSAALIVLLATAANGKALAGQSEGETSIPAIPAANNSWPEVNLNAVVLDKHGAPQAVDEKQFRLFEDGAERPLQFRGSPDSPVSIGFIVDCSGSMFNRRELVATAVKTIVKTLPEGSEVMEVSFSDQAFIDLRLTPVSGIDPAFPDHLDARGGTALYDAVIATEKYFAAHARYVRRALVLISDGYDNASKAGLEEAMRSLQYPGAPTFYAASVYGEKKSYAEVRLGSRAMEFLAQAGGGVAFTSSKDKDLPPAVARLADMISSQSVLHFTAADPERNGVARKLEVRLPIKEVEIHALPAYFAPAK